MHSHQYLQFASVLLLLIGSVQSGAPKDPLVVPQFLTDHGADPVWNPEDAIKYMSRPGLTATTFTTVPSSSAAITPGIWTADAVIPFMRIPEMLKTAPLELSGASPTAVPSPSSNINSPLLDMFVSLTGHQASDTAANAVIHVHRARVRRPTSRTSSRLHHPPQ